MTNQLPNPSIAVILAGGKARRYAGQDKGEILIGGERLIDIIHGRLKSQAEEIVISGTQDYGLGFRVISDADDAPGGPVGGLYSVWKALSSRHIQGFFTVAVDGPNLPDNLLASLYNDGASTIANDDLGRHPTYSWWRMKDLDNVFIQMETSQSISLNKLAELTGAAVVCWQGDNYFININRPEDLKSYVKHS